MEHEDYPALYQAADEASLKCQKNYLFLIRSYLLILILASLFSFIGITTKILAIISAILFFATISISIYILVKQYQKKWYNLRALAESVKTLTWRYMMCAEPFQISQNNKEVKQKFSEMLNKILQQNKTNAEEFSGISNSYDQLSETMQNVREKIIAERKLFYLEKRIKEQRKWYSKKTISNKRGYKIWFSLMIISQVVAVVTVLCRIAYPNFEYFPTEVLTVCTASILSWIQLKNYQEHSAAFSLASLEIGTFQNYILEITDEKEFSEFVIESENAFSREHTQWAAKLI